MKRRRSEGGRGEQPGRGRERRWARARGQRAHPLVFGTGWGPQAGLSSGRGTTAHAAPPQQSPSLPPPPAPGLCCSSGEALPAPVRWRDEAPCASGRTTSPRRAVRRARPFRLIQTLHAQPSRGSATRRPTSITATSASESPAAGCARGAPVLRTGAMESSGTSGWRARAPSTGSKSPSLPSLPASSTHL